MLWAVISSSIKKEKKAGSWAGGGGGSKPDLASGSCWVKNILSARCSEHFKRPRRRHITHARQCFQLSSQGSPSPGNGEDGAGPLTPSLHTLSPSLASGWLQGGINRGQHSPERRAAPSQVCCRQSSRRSGLTQRLPAPCGPSPGQTPSQGRPSLPLHKPSPSPGQNLRPINNESLGLEFSSANAHSWG